ncbi:YifB family Mg chelatase-like AAA ATPase [Sorangium cellulosum]|uniref:ATP-dependent protease n=1 Tax=Sorangium cellulosum TaxID=56 RepID=A0A150QS77_SORCE|nr:YifB family Mg chelatase-like AAA ATPase [Sorangium cellulosum]KYF70814.1 ATP-dependent protease [Sorangium cellulosum]
MKHSKNAPHTDAVSVSLIGLEAHLVHIETTITQAPASFEIIGLSEARQRETRIRVCAALQQLHVDLHQHGVSVRVGPEEVARSGTFDVPMALTILAALGQISTRSWRDTLVLGELSLGGASRPVRGVLPSLRGAIAHGITRAIVPKANAREAARVPGIRVLVADQLVEVVRYFREDVPLESAGEPPPFPVVPPAAAPDLADLRGMHAARRALEIAAGGGHHLLLMGPPGAGKTSLTRRMPGILPPLSLEEATEVTSVYSVAGLLVPEVGFVGTRPFRAPHHTVSGAGLVGGGEPVRPGEVSLAHHGVLFLDELLDFRSSVLETLRQPLDEGRVTLVRGRTHTTFPAQTLVVAAINPCPCGFVGDYARRCVCSPERLRAYRARLSDPLFDRFDVQVALPPVDIAALRSRSKDEPSCEVQKRVIAARAAQEERARAGATGRSNAQLSPRELEQVATPDAAGARVLADATERLGFSAAGYRRVLRVARTIADLDGSDGVHAPHVAEAVHAVLLPPRGTAATPPG